MTFTNKELRDFEISLVGYKQGKYGALDTTAYMIDKGILVNQGGTYTAIREERIKDYDEFLLKLQLLSDLQARTAAAKKHEAEALEKLPDNATQLWN